ncbi:SGNH/GDSL hydrolase family protein [Frigoribacterium sp. PhB116]|uniref:SGNH/GDSL hydrolase family protein n=1 Tax=Frigoribacterium sp. PhB116 TaxID=2485174 RepID=UPI00105C947B|nr:SGNH/GDSL hydrolase family protein [Frigoribacterium sp. PhB116]TDT64126.1 lysophospholipase L1-like esterase [Frigoribacterium sp. PhB116]
MTGASSMSRSPSTTRSPRSSTRRAALPVAGLLTAALLLTGCTGGGGADDDVTSGATGSASAAPDAGTGTNTSSDDAWAAWDAALVDVDGSPARWLAVGDSITEGQGASSVDARWVDLTRDALRAAHPVDGVTGGVGYRPAVFATYGPDSPWGDWATDRQGGVDLDGTSPALGFRSLELEPGARVSWPVTGTDVDLWWAGGGGSFTWDVDGTRQGQVDTGASSASSSVTPVEDLGSGPHTVTVTVAAGDRSDEPVVLHGLAAFDGDRERGVTLYDSARSGATTGTFTDDLAGWLEAVAAAEPDVVTITLGANDLRGSSPEEFADGYRDVVEGLQALDAPPTVVVVDEFPVAAGLADTGQAPIADYAAALDEVVDETGVVSVSLGDALAGAGNTDLRSLLSSDGLHPNDAGQRAIAAFMTGVLGR